MEKYARQAVSEGLQRSEDIHVNKDSEIYRVLNLHYNRNNHIEVHIKEDILTLIMVHRYCVFTDRDSR